MIGAATARRAGAGRLVLIVGPSGAGKDSLIWAARAELAGDPGFVFPRRVITRPPSADEDNEACSPADFAARAAEGDFALSWAAHGLDYGIPIGIEDALAEHRTVVCNVSRTVVEEARRRYGGVLVIEVTAHAPVLAERLARRGRVADGDIGRRIERARGVTVHADVTVANDGRLEAACASLLQVLTGRTLPVA